jgi:hypothetical protein
MKQTFLTELLPEELQPPMALDAFIERMGISRAAAYAWRKKGILRTLPICGKQYVPAKEIVAFNRRMEAGEFAGQHHAPPRGGKDAKAAQPRKAS